MTDYPVRVCHNLSVSDIETVMSADISEYDTVVSVCQDCKRDNVSQEYLHFPLADDMRSKESYGGSVDYETFYGAAETVAERIGDEHVLVHCHAGRNRSVSVCAAVGAVKEDVSVLSIYSDLHYLDVDVQPSPLMQGFAEQLVNDTNYGW